MSEAQRFDQLSEDEDAILNWENEGNPNCADVSVLPRSIVANHTTELTERQAVSHLIVTRREPTTTPVSDTEERQIHARYASHYSQEDFRKRLSMLYDAWRDARNDFFPANSRTTLGRWAELHRVAWVIARERPTMAARP